LIGKLIGCVAHRSYIIDGSIYDIIDGNIIYDAGSAYRCGERAFTSVFDIAFIDVTNLDIGDIAYVADIDVGGVLGVVHGARGGGGADSEPGGAAPLRRPRL